jgi:histidinol phosphatase-like enzyme
MEKRGDIKTIEDFEGLLEKNRKLKKKILHYVYNKKEIPKKFLVKFRKHYFVLNNIKKEEGKFVLEDGENKIQTNLHYEISEMKKDLVYLEKGEKKLMKYLSSLDKNFETQKNKLVKRLDEGKFDFFVFDRDGTVNNYSERYISSVQSVYNAIFLMNFISKKSKDSLMITSASLEDFFKVSIIPKHFARKHHLVFSGSKGREFKFNKLFGNSKIPLSQDQEKLMDKLKEELENLLSQNKYKKFKTIGSGYQEKQGQITIARQDISKSIKSHESKKFLEKVETLVDKLDKRKRNVFTHDTGKDIEIIFKLKDRKFDKSLGVEYVIEELKIKPKSFLVCGDTLSDIPFFKLSKNRGKRVSSIFVTKDSHLKSKLKESFPGTSFVSSPDILVSALNEVSK